MGVKLEVHLPVTSFLNQTMLTNDLNTNKEERVQGLKVYLTWEREREKMLLNDLLRKTRVLNDSSSPVPSLLRPPAGHMWKWMCIHLDPGASPPLWTAER